MTDKKLQTQPIVILGGFLITDEAYAPMVEWFKKELSLSLKIVHVSKFDWLLTSWAFGWRRILDRVDQAVLSVQNTSPTGKVTLIGHSSGGVMLRLYLADLEFAGRIYGGRKRCNYLISLGSPHQAKRATRLRAMVDNLYPGCFYAEDVRYISVAGSLPLDTIFASDFAKKTARNSYQSMIENRKSEGDGLVPLESALLKDSKHIVLPETSHSKIFGDNWYGELSTIPKWWQSCFK